MESLQEIIRLVYQYNFFMEANNWNNLFTKKGAFELQRRP